MSVNTTPATWAAGESPSSVKMNAEIRDFATGVQAAWDTYTPTWGGGSTIGNGTITAAWKRVGKDVHFYVQITLGSTSSIGVSSMTLTLPTAAKTGLSPVFVGEAYDTSAGGAVGVRTNAQSSTVAVLLVPGTTAGGFDRPVTSTVPFTWATGDRIWISGTYEAA